VESLAPDQASLTAASKLAKAAKWLSLSCEGDLWWGECQGSGANPYRTVVDSGVVGYKCTCPSRKFPCKHSLALMWIAAQSPGDFARLDFDEAPVRRRPCDRPPFEPFTVLARVAEVPCHGVRSRGGDRCHDCAPR